MIAKNHISIFGFIKFKRYFLLLILLTLIMACGLFSPRELDFENDSLSIDLPDDWIWGGDYYGAGTKLFSIRNSGGILPSAIISLATLEYANSPNPLLMIEQAYNNHGVMEQAEAQAYQDDSLSGEEVYFLFGRGDATWRVREIWLENDGTVYILSFRATNPSFDNYMGTFEQMLESLRFMEN